MSICDPPNAWCTDGCVDTTLPECTIYKGAHLGTINIQNGQSLAVALANINNLLRDLAKESTTVPSFSYSVLCSESEDTVLSLQTFKKNGLSQIVGSIQFPNSFSLLAHLRTVDVNWQFTAPNVFSIVSTHNWELAISCPNS